VGDVPALVGTLYGRLLLAKLALFALMLALAMAQSLVSSRCGSPQATRTRAADPAQRSAEISSASSSLRSSACSASTPPAIHETPVWPFAHTLSFAPAEQSPWLLMALVAAGLTASFAQASCSPRIRRHRLGNRWRASPRSSCWRNLSAAARNACLSRARTGRRRFPTRRMRSSRADVYAANCRECHGLHRLDGAVCRQLAVGTRASEHALRHRDGEHYWWIAHGIPGTSMPAFGSRLPTTTSGT
jgi:hypothetical protein